jgi:hybrid cluster-associated redox disulfide protein
MEQPQLEANLIVAEVLTRWPQTIPAFLQHRMACVGCAIAPFATIAEVAAIYHLDLDYFLDELEQAINSRPGSTLRDR